MVCRGGSGIRKQRGTDLLMFTVITVMKSDVTIDFFVDVVHTNVHTVARILLDLLESEVSETIYSLQDLSKQGPCSSFCYADGLLGGLKQL